LDISPDGLATNLVGVTTITDSKNCAENNGWRTASAVHKKAIWIAGFSR